MAKKLYIGTTRVFDDNVVGQVAQGLGSADNVEFEDITCNNTVSYTHLTLPTNREV